MNIKRVENKNIWWRWQVDKKYKWLGVAYFETGCWLFDTKYGKKGAKIWQEREQPGRLIILSGNPSGNHKNYTTAVNLFAKKCKNKLKDKYFVKKYKLSRHLKIKSSDVFKYYGIDYLLNKFNLNIDVVKYILEFIPFDFLKLNYYISY
jgi:hypothetical protein